MKKLLLLALIVIAPNVHAMYMGSAAMASARRRHEAKQNEVHTTPQTRKTNAPEVEAEMQILQRVACCLCTTVAAICYLNGNNQ